MRGLLMVLLLLVVGVVALGFYRGWFTFERTSDPQTGRQGVQIEVDQSKIAPDIEKAKETIGGKGAQAGDKPQGQQP